MSSMVYNSLSYTYFRGMRSWRSCRKCQFHSTHLQAGSSFSWPSDLDVRQPCRWILFFLCLIDEFKVNVRLIFNAEDNLLSSSVMKKSYVLNGSPGPIPCRGGPPRTNILLKLDPTFHTVNLRSLRAAVTSLRPSGENEIADTWL